ncbi:MAG: ABC transporter permease, partial [bacterium]|nr:ABC transporter permease [bacterium]
MSTRYLLQKFFRAFLTICIIVTFVFIALRMSGDAALQIYGADVDEAVLEALRESWGLDKPIWQQYLIYIGNIFHGDLGKSYLDGRDAVEVVMERVPKTLS